MTDSLYIPPGSFEAKPNVFKVQTSGLNPDPGS